MDYKGRIQVRRKLRRRDEFRFRPGLSGCQRKPDGKRKNTKTAHAEDFK
jgi:hypothetical protein